MQDVSTQVNKLVEAREKFVVTTCTMNTHFESYKRDLAMKIDTMSAKFDGLNKKVDALTETANTLSNTVEGCVQTVANMHTDISSRSGSLGCCSGSSAAGTNATPQQQTMH